MGMIISKSKFEQRELNPSSLARAKEPMLGTENQESTDGAPEISVSFESLRPSHFGELAGLMHNAFGNCVNAQYFDWKYVNNPLGPAVGNIARADSSGKIVAFYGLIPQLYRFNGQDRLLYQSCDTMTHSDFRRRGLFQSLAQRTFKEQLSKNEQFFAIGFGGSNSAPGFLKMGWTKVFELSHSLKPRFLSTLNRNKNSSDVNEYCSITADIAKCFEKRHRDIQDGIVLDHAYLEWKWTNPRKNYKFLSAGTSVCVYHVKEDLLYIDYVIGEDRDGLRAIGRRIDLLVTCLPVRGVTSFAQTGSPMELTLRDWGFFTNPFNRGPGSRRLPFIAYSGSKSEARLMSSTAWDISPIDHDNF